MTYYFCKHLFLMNNCFWPILVFLCISFMMKTRVWNFSNFKTFLPSLRVVLHLYCSGLVPPHFLPEWVLMGIPSSYLAPVSSSCQLCFTYYIETDQVFPLLCSPQWLCLPAGRVRLFLEKSKAPLNLVGASLTQPLLLLPLAYLFFNPIHISFTSLLLVLMISSLMVTLLSASWPFHPPVFGCTIQWVSKLSF